MEGYHGRERHETFDPDGWFRTGDLFHVDADGLHYFHGRRGDMIKTAGANVSPREVEAVLADAAGLRAHVVGLDDAERGQRVAAVLVSDAPVDLAALEGAAARAPFGLQGAAHVPRARRGPGPDAASSGKLDLRALKALLRWALSRPRSLRSCACAPSATPTSPRSCTTTRRSPTASSTRGAARSPRGSSPPASASARVSAC